MKKINTRGPVQLVGGQQAGFTAVEGLLILVVVGIIGGVGWFVFKSKDDTNKTYDNSANSYTNQTAKTTESTTMCEASEEGMLHIHELGIQLKLDAKVLDATCAKIKDYDSHYPIGLSTKALEKYDANCKAEMGSVAQIVVFTNPNGTDASVANGTNIENFPDAIKVGNKYYAIFNIGHQSPCGKEFIEAQHEALEGFEKSEIEKME